MPPPAPPPLKGDSSPAGFSTGLGDSDGGALPLKGLPLPSGDATTPERLRLKEPLPLFVRAMLLMLVCTLGLTVCARNRGRGQPWSSCTLGHAKHDWKSNIAMQTAEYSKKISIADQPDAEVYHSKTAKVYAHPAAGAGVH